MLGNVESSPGWVRLAQSGLDELDQMMEDYLEDHT